MMQEASPALVKLSPVQPTSMNTRSFEFVDLDGVSFAGHESFPLRYGWLKKGFDCLVREDGSEDRSFFGREEAMTELGVGKNMVRAIRHWGLTLGVWEEVDGSRGREVAATPFGKNLLTEDGFDPYFEKPATPWLLHYLLVTNRTRATTWAWTFARPRRNRFEKSELVRDLVELARDIGASRVSEGTIKRDVDVLLRSYCRPTLTSRVTEEALDCPFVQLHLIRPAIEKGEYEIVFADHPTLPNFIVAFAILDFLGWSEASADAKQTRLSMHNARRSATLDELVYAPFSPGRVFRLDERAMVSRLNSLIAEYPQHFMFDDTAGLRQLLLRSDLPSAGRVLRSGYGPNQAEAR
jgi:hypothetical protein